MTLQEKIRPIGQAMTATGLKVYHYWRSGIKEKRYIVWAEDNEYGNLMADNHKAAQGIRGTIDLFTSQEYDPAADTIQAELEALEHVGWRLNSVQYEEGTNLVHHEWEFYIG